MNMYVTKSTTSILLSGFVGWTLPVKDLHVFLLKFLNMCVMWYHFKMYACHIHHQSLHVIPQQKIKWTLDWILLLGLKKDSSSSMYSEIFSECQDANVRLKFRKIHSPYIKDASMKNGDLSRPFQNNLVRFKYK